MDTSPHTLSALFAQLGLPDGDDDIDRFIRKHQRDLSPNLRLEEADFWTPAQADFLHEAVAQDSDWCELVDELDAMLRLKIQ